MQVGIIVLGEKTYTITELPARGNAAWRNKVEPTLKEILSILDHIPEIEVDVKAGRIQVGKIFDLVRKYSPLLLERIDDVSEWIISYSPKLEEDREYILDHAYESEMLVALLEVLKLAFPFTGMAQSGMTGLTGRLTSTNSVSANGESGQTK